MTRAGALLIVACLFVACGPSRPALKPVELPDVSRVDPAVQSQIRQQFDVLQARINNHSTPLPDLADAYGRFGMLTHAAQFPDVAATAYVNAQTLAPGELRWPYYLGDLYRSMGQADAAAASFERALELNPGDLPTLIWLGRLSLDQGRPDTATPLFLRALQIAPQSVAALAGLGRAALAKRDYMSAAQYFERALAIDPQAESLHAPLATAYRGLGELDKARPHLRQWRNTDILLPDPLRQELDLLLESALSYELRGVRALDSRNWNAAQGFFRRGLELAQPGTPLQRSLQHKLGTALFIGGDADGAAAQFEAVVASAPAEGIDESTAKAHYSLGVMASQRGRDADAVMHLTAAVRYQPSYLEAHLALADALRKAGRLREALGHYDEAIDINPREPAGRLGHAIALAGLRRDAEARGWLETSAQQYPDRPQFAHALARLLASSADAHVRDGARARVLVTGLFSTDKSTGLGETMAMTLAELGDYDQAVLIQRGVLEATRTAGLTEAARRMEENLRRYEQHQPCRVPWRNDEPVFLPGAGG